MSVITEQPTSAVVVLPGPSHPDLFDGETPIMLPMPASEALGLWAVHVEISKEWDIVVTARDAAEAERIAARMIERDQDYDAHLVAKSSWLGTPTDEEVDDYLNDRQEVVL